MRPVSAGADIKEARHLLGARDGETLSSAARRFILEMAGDDRRAAGWARALMAERLAVRDALGEGDDVDIPVAARRVREERDRLREEAEGFRTALAEALEAKADRAERGAIGLASASQISTHAIGMRDAYREAARMARAMADGVGGPQTGE